LEYFFEADAFEQAKTIMTFCLIGGRRQYDMFLWYAHGRTYRHFKALSAALSSDAKWRQQWSTEARDRL